MSVADIVRGPDRVERLDIEEWIVTSDKGPAGFQPGFRAVDARDTRPIGERPVYQLELDLEKYPDLATSAEIVGTAIYHAIGYNVVDTYLVNVDPKKVRVNPASRTARTGCRRAASSKAGRWVTSPTSARARTIPMTSIRTSIGASCGPTASSRHGFSTTIRAR
jgi:hypothetical protein